MNEPGKNELNTKEITACFTGHRTIPRQLHAALRQQLEMEILTLIAKGYLYFGVGGALGFDTLAAQVVLELKRTHPQIKLILVQPCATQPDRWTVRNREQYEQIREQADKIVCISERYTRDCMYKRNRHLVDCSSVCLCFQVKHSGGTAYTVEYAQQKGLHVINLAQQI